MPGTPNDVLDMNITAPINAVATQPQAPEFFRLPSRGPDPFFGLTRSYYYQLETAGSIRLTRIRDRGKLRGITLVPYDVVRTFIRSQMTEAPAPKEAA